MDNSHFAFQSPNYSGLHSQPSMDYFNRIFNHYPRSSRNLQHARALFTLNSNKQLASPRHHQSHKHHRHKKHRRDMTSFNGPWCSNLEAMKTAVQSMPTKYKSSFSSTSKDTLDKICDPNILHIWESDSDIDDLLQLASVIAKHCKLGTRKDKCTDKNDGSMIIIAEEKPGRNSFLRICQLVEYLTGVDAKKHLEGIVAAIGSIIVVKGWNSRHRLEEPQAVQEAEDAVKGINMSIERAFKMGTCPRGEKKLVWHHGPAIHFLLHCISTSSNLRKALCAITITGSLDLTSTVKPSMEGRMNTLLDLQRLESFAKRLAIPVVFLDPASQLITFPPLTIYMIYYGYYINTFLPAAILRPHWYKAHDELVTFAFQLYGASKGRYGENAVRFVKQHLNRSTAKNWARKCIDPHSYEKSKCRAAGREDVIDGAVHLADSPISRFTQDTNLTAFARLSVGPTATGGTQYHIAAPVQIDFKQARLRPSKPATFHILIPTKDQDVEKVTNQIQGLMLAVLECVRQGKGNPVLGDEQKAIWKDVVASCSWALDECKGKMPKDVEAKVKFVKEKFSKGTWGYALGSASSGVKANAAVGSSDAAGANEAASAAYAAAQQMGQQLLASQMGYGAGSHPYAGHAAPIAPPTSPHVGAGQTVYTQGQIVPPQGYLQQHGSGGYVSNRGEQGMYPQSMGGPWH